MRFLVHMCNLAGILGVSNSYTLQNGPRVPPHPTQLWLGALQTRLRLAPEPCFTLWIANTQRLAVKSQHQTTPSGDWQGLCWVKVLSEPALLPTPLNDGAGIGWGCGPEGHDAILLPQTLFSWVDWMQVIHTRDTVSSSLTDTEGISPGHLGLFFVLENVQNWYNKITFFFNETNISPLFFPFFFSDLKSN